MRHATILDAFNEASRFTQQTLGVLTKEKEYELDTELYKQSIELSTLQNELILDYSRIDETGRMFQLHPEKYQEYVEGRLAEWKQNAKAAGNGSRYYTSKLDQLDSQGRLAMGQRYKSAIVETEKTRTSIAYDRTNNLALNNENNIENLATIISANLKTFEDLNAGDTGKIYAERQKAFSTLFDRAQTIDFDSMPAGSAAPGASYTAGIGKTSVAEMMGRRDTQMGVLYSTAEKHLPEGESIDGYITNKQERLKESESAIRITVQKSNAQNVENNHAKFKAAVDEYEKNPSQANLQRVLAWEREGRDFVNQQENSPDYNGEFKNKMQGMYQLPEAILKKIRGDGEKKGEVLTESQARTLLATQMKRGMLGETSTTTKELYKTLSGTLNTAAANAGFDINRPDSRMAIEKQHNDFWDVFKDVITKDPELVHLKPYYDQIVNLRTASSELNKLYDPSTQAFMDGYLAIEAINFLGGINHKNLKDGELNQRFNDLKARIINLAKNQDEIKLTGWDVSPRKTVLEELKKRNSPAWREAVELDTKGNPVIMPGHETRMRQMDEEEEKLVSAFTSISTESLTPVWDTDPDNPNERTAQRIYRIKETDRYLKLIPGDGEDFTVVEKKTGTSGYGWRQAEGKAPPPDDKYAKAQELQEARNQRDTRITLSNTERMFEEIRNNPEPAKRRELLNMVMTGIGQSVTPDDAWRNGVNPRTAEKVTAMPAEIYDRILASCANEDDRQAQLGKWQRMGITREKKK